MSRVDDVFRSVGRIVAVSVAAISIALAGIAAYLVYTVCQIHIGTH